jgi:hypothetical protein
MENAGALELLSAEIEKGKEGFMSRIPEIYRE